MRWVLFAIAGLSVFCICAALWFTAAPGSGARTPPSFSKVKETYRRSDSLLLDRYGEVIHEMRVDEQIRRLEWTDLNDVSPAFIKALLAVEDKRFYQHHGVDWRALGSSALTNGLRKKTRGASTITMQLAAKLDKKLRPKGARRSIFLKREQIQAALNLEKTWSKNQVLEAYINLISYRGELQGISAASRGLFDKLPSGLNEAESLLLASMITSPNGSINSIAARACHFRSNLPFAVDCNNLETLARDKLAAPYRVKAVIALAPQVARILLNKSNTSVTSTIDGELQRFAKETLNRQLALLKDSNVSDGALLVMDNKTGEVLAYVGNGELYSSAAFVDGVQAPRQAGSTLKPFLYELAMEQKLLTAASVLDDSPLDVTTPTGLYVPRNYDHLFRGYVTARTALSSSLNVPAVRVLLLVGLDPFVERLKKLGFESLTEEPEYYGYSLALGSADVTLYDLANAYRTLANGGFRSEPKLTPVKTTSRGTQVLKPDAAYIISHILSDREARSATFGFENPLSTRFWTAVKTGTSKDMRDNWCVGFSEHYTVGVWVGNFSGEPMHNVSGISGAAPVWLDLMNYLHMHKPSRAPKPTDGVVFSRVTFAKGLESSRRECFLKGTEPDSEAPTVVLNTNYQKPHITYPAPDMLISVDPEIPGNSQRVPFRFQPAAAKYEWVINDQKTGVFDPLFLWNPSRGKYTVSIIDKNGAVLDSVAFTVR